MRKSTSCVEVWHEYGSSSHYQGLTCLISAGGGNVKFFEFRFLRQFVKGLFRFNRTLIYKSIINMGALVFRLMGGGGGRIVVIGVAPFDWRAIFLVVAFRNGTIYWHNSWPIWDGSRSAKSSVFGEIAWRRLFLPRVSRAFFVTRLAAENYLASGYPRLPISVVGHSFDDKCFYPDLNSRRAIGIDGKIRFLFVGRVEEIKGVYMALEVAEVLGRSLSVELVIAGEGPECRRLREIAEDKSIPLEFLGFQKSRALADEMRKSDFLLLPSRRGRGWEEAFGMVVIESMACGCIPFCTDHSGPREILERSFPFLLSPELTYVDQCCAFVNNLMSEQVSTFFLRSELVASARDFTLSAAGEKWSAILDSPGY